MKIRFAKETWNTDEITYAYSYRFDATPTFEQQEECVKNCQNPEAVYGFDNISLLTRKKYGPDAKISTRCSFEDMGAPLIVIADALYEDSHAVMKYGNYIEVVLYKGGVNVWRMKMRDGKVTWKLLMGVSFPVSENEIHTLSVEIKSNMLAIQADDKRMSLRIENMYSMFHLGINACEGINRFYDLEIEG